MPMSKIPFRIMNATLKMIQMQTTVALASKEFKFDESFYAFQFALNGLVKQSNNPTHKERLAQIVVWFQHYQSIIDAIPDGLELKMFLQKSKDELFAPYAEVVSNGRT